MLTVYISFFLEREERFPATILLITQRTAPNRDIGMINGLLIDSMNIIPVSKIDIRVFWDQYSP
jgi:hypothetical protein